MNAPVAAFARATHPPDPGEVDDLRRELTHRQKWHSWLQRDIGVLTGTLDGLSRRSLSNAERIDEIEARLAELTGEP